MLRRTLTIFSLIGLLLSVAAWGLSYRGGIASSVWSGRRWASIEARRGKAVASYLSLDSFGFPQFVDAATMAEMRGVYLRPLAMPREDFYFRSANSGIVGWEVTAWRLGFPIWVVFLMFLAPCLIVGQGSIRVFFRRRKRKKLGLCLDCGYDLRGLTEPRCPECNTPFESHDA